MTKQSKRPRVISPPKSELSTLRTPLNEAEKLVFDLFDQQLFPKWEIYLQPHLNGLRPDFVLLNPEGGIGLFEVKGWHLDKMDYFVRTVQGKPILMAEKDGKQFCPDNPITQIDVYRQEILKLYCPSLQIPRGIAAVTCGLIFPFADEEALNKLFAPFREGMTGEVARYNPIVGKQSIYRLANGNVGGNIDLIFPDNKRQKSRLMEHGAAKSLRHWLIEPSFSSDQRNPLKLDKNQTRLATTRTTSGYRRIKGPAGSGKSLVLAARAAELIAEGKNVLVVTFNITLLNYLMDLSVRWKGGREGNTRKDVTWLNFHDWCSRVCKTTGYEDEFTALWELENDSDDGEQDKKGIDAQVMQDNLRYGVVEVVEEVFADQEARGKIAMYDAILVDEGQDFLPEWWTILRKACKPGGEMLLVADVTQDIYDTAKSWTDEAMIGAGFSGAWGELKTSYRMPRTALRYANRFAELFLPEEKIDLDVGTSNEQGELNLYPCHLEWRQCFTDSNEHKIEHCVQAISDMMEQSEPTVLAVSDIVFLCTRNDFGLDVVKSLGNKKIRVSHTFGRTQQEGQQLKKQFYMGDANIKATTLHSFKGWESKALVVFVDQSWAIRPTEFALIYTGLTRLKRTTTKSYLTVVCTDPRFEEFGKEWPLFSKVD